MYCAISCSFLIPRLDAARYLFLTGRDLVDAARHLLVIGVDIGGNSVDATRHLVLSRGDPVNILLHRVETERHCVELLLIERTGGWRGWHDHVRECSAQPVRLAALTSQAEGQLATMYLAASPYDCQAKVAATPAQNLTSKRGQGASDGRSFGNRSFFSSAGRRARASTDGPDG